MEVRDEEIIKALEKALTDVDAPIGEHWGSGFLSTQTIKSALDLIHRQKAEKEELEFELIRSRNEMKAWKIRASWYKEKRSKLECKNSELEIELKAMRGAANSYKSEVERYREVVGELAVAEDGTVTGLLNGKETKFIDKEVAETFKRFAVSEARKKFAERFMIEAAKILEINTIYWMREIKNKLLAEMEERE